MAIAVSILLFVLLMGAITYYGYRMYARPTQLYEQIGSQIVAGEWQPDQQTHSPFIKVLAGVGE